MDKNHVSFELFKLGRLQFQIYKCKNATLNYSKLPFKYGDYVISVHVPACGKLDIKECEESLASAVNFFAKYFPELRWEYFFCESWLLYNKNSEFMDNNSNIIKFSKLFDINYSINYENQTFERVFGINNLPVFKSQIKNYRKTQAFRKVLKNINSKRTLRNRYRHNKKQAVLTPAQIIL